MLIYQTLFKVFSSNIFHIEANDNALADSCGIMTLTLAKGRKVSLNLIIWIPFDMDMFHRRVLPVYVDMCNGKAMHEDHCEVT